MVNFAPPHPYAVKPAEVSQRTEVASASASASASDFCIEVASASARPCRRNQFVLSLPPIHFASVGLSTPTVVGLSRSIDHACPRSHLVPVTLSRAQALRNFFSQKFASAHLLAMATPAKKQKTAPTQVASAPKAPTPPPAPTPPGPMPTLEEYSAGTAVALEPYMSQVVAYASHAARAKICEAPLRELAPLQISTEAPQAAARSYKVHWDNETCRKSLCSTQLFESGGCATWFEVGAAVCRWGGAALPGCTTTWPQVLSAMALWAEERYVASAEEEPPHGVSLSPQTCFFSGFGF